LHFLPFTETTFSTLFDSTVTSGIGGTTAAAGTGGNASSAKLKALNEASFSRRFCFFLSFFFLAD
jgi:hypothetical protein